MSDIDFQIVAVEHELEKMRNEQPKAVSTDAPVASSSRLGCLQVFIYFFVGLLLFQLILEIINIVVNLAF